MFDGDTIFALATGKVRASPTLVGAYAAEVVAAGHRGRGAERSRCGWPAGRRGRAQMTHGRGRGQCVAKLALILCAATLCACAAPSAAPAPTRAAAVTTAVTGLPTAVASAASAGRDRVETPGASVTPVPTRSPLPPATATPAATATTPAGAAASQAPTPTATGRPPAATREAVANRRGEPASAAAA